MTTDIRVMPFRPDTIEASILGGAIGDMLGGITERGDFSFSDDTQLTLATCEALMTSGGADAERIALQMLTWFRSGRITGIGSSTLKAMRDLDAGAHWALAGARGEMAAGNGAAMRAAPLAFVLDPARSDHRAQIRDISRITHHHDEAYVGALAVVHAIRNAAERGAWPNEQIVSHLPDSRVRDHLSSAAGTKSLSSLVSELGSSGFVAETVAVSFELARQICSIGFEAAIFEMNNLGGDTDTIGSIAGQIAGAALGSAPSELLAPAVGVERVKRIARQFAAFASAI